MLSFGEPIDLVIEHQQIHVEVPAQQVNGMVAADAHAVAIATHDPYTEFWSCSFQPGSNSSSAPMDRVHTIGIHIVRKPAAAANARNDHNIFPGKTQGGHHFLHLCKDGIIAAPGTPAHF